MIWKDNFPILRVINYPTVPLSPITLDMNIYYFQLEANSRMPKNKKQIYKKEPL